MKETGRDSLLKMDEDENNFLPGGARETEEEQETGEGEGEEEEEEDETTNREVEELEEDESAPRVEEEGEGDGVEGGGEEKEEEEESTDDSERPPPPEPEQESVAEPSPRGIPPAPPLLDAGLQRSVEEEEEEVSPNALNIRWSFGLNKDVPVINLSDVSAGRRCALYVCAHVGVIFDFHQNLQHLLQGHRNNITATAASENRRWVVTADEGSDSTVIVWDTTTDVPVKTIFGAHDEGVAAVALSPDARFLVTVSAGFVQEVSVWDWTEEAMEDPICTSTLEPRFGRQTFVAFNPQDNHQLVSNSDVQVIFYSWDTSGMNATAPPLADEDFNKAVGKFSQSIFVAHSGRALTATSLGNLVVWDETRDSSSPDQKRALKLVKIQDRGFTVLTTIDDYIVTGDVAGQVKFFDNDIKLLFCPTKKSRDDAGLSKSAVKSAAQDAASLGPVNTVSFEYAPDFVGDPTLGDPATIDSASRFVVRDFLIGTSTAVVAHVGDNASRVKRIMTEHDQSVFALATHPFETLVAVGSDSGLLKIWDYFEKRTMVARQFDNQMSIRCCAFDPSGSFLAVAFSSGAVAVLDAVSLENESGDDFRFSRDAVTHVAFSHDSQFLATADADRCVTVFRRRTEDIGPPYAYVGKQRPHYKAITRILFGVQLDSNFPRLLSLGLDRVLVEYDLENSSEDDLRLLSSDRIEQSALPTCMTWYPAVTKESFILAANDAFKFKLFNSTTKMCRRTLLGPTYGSPLRKLEPLPATDTPGGPETYLAFCTDDRVGLQKVPLDGNPHNSVTFIAHPLGVADFAVSCDGRFIFSAGGTDASVHMWEINLKALEASSQLGGSGLTPFLGLLEGGDGGPLFSELEDYFYYAMLRSQGVDTMERRRVAVTIPLQEIPFVMRAMGFYPSEQEIDDMLNEVKFGEFVETGRYVEDIDLGNFIKLYVNHRPAFGLSLRRLAWAFETLGVGADDFEDEDEGPSVERSMLLQGLQTRGEHMTELELAEFVATLLGHTEEGGVSEQQLFDPMKTAEIIEREMPKNVSANKFCQEMLGFPLYSSEEDSQSGRRSGGEYDAASVGTQTTAPPAGTPHLMTDPR